MFYEKSIINVIFNIIYFRIVTSSEDILDASRRTIKEASRRHHIILGMLELSKLESKDEVKLEELNIKNIVIDVLEQFNSEIQEKNLAVTTNIDDLILKMNYSHLYQLVK